MLLGLDSDDIESIVEGSTEEVLQIAENLNINATPPGISEKNKQKSGLPLAGGNESAAEQMRRRSNSRRRLPA